MLLFDVQNSVDDKGNDTSNIGHYGGALDGTVNTGVKGYYVLLDSNPSTIVNASNGVFVNGTSYTPSNDTAYNYYAHVASVDNAGNVSATRTVQFIDNTAPTLTAIPGTTNWSATNVAIPYTVSDTQTGIQSVTVNGVTIGTGSGTYTATTTGLYNFVVKDNVGNTNSTSVSVYVDKNKPTVNNSSTPYSNGSVNVGFNDTESGMSSYTMN